MNISLDPREWTVATPDHAAGQDCAHPEWHALRLRLHAGLQAWAMLRPARGRPGAQRFGSFSSRASESLERITGYCGPVNQTSSANRKRGGCIIPQVAGMSIIGERG
jgi:hypothetical protein